MRFDPNRRPPIVTDADRRWAERERPKDWDRRAPLLPWAQFVAEEAERFEAWHAAKRKSALEWSVLWRTEWWPKADPAVRHPTKVPRTPYPFWHARHPDWRRLLGLLSPQERYWAVRHGVITLRPDHPVVDMMARAA